MFYIKKTNKGEGKKKREKQGFNMAAMIEAQLCLWGDMSWCSSSHSQMKQLSHQVQDLSDWGQGQQTSKNTHTAMVKFVSAV